MWHSESPYNNIDPSFCLVEITDGDGKAEHFRINYGDGDGENTHRYEVLKEGKPFAKVTVNWKPGKRPTESAELMEMTIGTTLHPGIRSWDCVFQRLFVISV